MSNPVIGNMKSRRSCRALKPDPVPRERVEQIAEAGLWVRPFAMFFEDVGRGGCRGPRYRLAEDGRT